MTVPTPTPQTKGEHTTATISTDLHCVACGYNLRGLPAEGRCPECGTEISRSRLLFRRPDLVRLGLALTGVSFLIICLYPAAVLLRVIGIHQLRQHASLESIVGLRRAIHVMWFTCLIEVVIAAVFTIAWIAIQFSTAWWLQGAFWITVLAAAVCSLIIAWCAGTLGARLADFLVPTAIKTATRALRLLIGIASGIVLVFLLSIPLVSAFGPWHPFGVVSGLLFVGPILGIVITLLTAFILFDLAGAIAKHVQAK